MKCQITKSVFSSSIGDAPLEVLVGAEAVRPERDAADRPALVLLGHPFDEPVVGEAVLELFELDAQVAARRSPTAP